MIPEHDCEIRNKHQMPNGGWLYRERIKGQYYNINDLSLGYDDVVARIAEVRKKSGLACELTLCAQALCIFTRRRLNGDARWFPRKEGVPPSPPKGCVGCGRKKRK